MCVADDALSLPWRLQWPALTKLMPRCARPGAWASPRRWRSPPTRRLPPATRRRSLPRGALPCDEASRLLRHQTPAVAGVEPADRAAVPVRRAFGAGVPASVPGVAPVPDAPLRAAVERVDARLRGASVSADPSAAGAAPAAVAAAVVDGSDDGAAVGAALRGVRADGARPRAGRAIAPAEAGAAASRRGAAVAWRRASSARSSSWTSGGTSLHGSDDVGGRSISREGSTYAGRGLDCCGGDCGRGPRLPPIGARLRSGMRAMPPPPPAPPPKALVPERP